MPSMLTIIDGRVTIPLNSDMNWTPELDQIVQFGAKFPDIDSDPEFAEVFSSLGVRERAWAQEFLEFHRTARAKLPVPAQLRLARFKGIPRQVGLPAFFDAPIYHRDALSLEQSKVIREWMRKSVGYANIVRNVKSGDEYRGQDLDANRAQMEFLRTGSDSAHAEWTRIMNQFEASIDDGPVRALVRGAPGTGKSSAVNTAMTSIKSPGLIAWILVPTLERAKENVAEYNKIRKQLNGFSLPCMLIKGRSAPIDSDRDQPMCARADIVREAQNEGVDVEELICKPCPLRESCPYIEQRREAFSMAVDGGVFMMAQDYAFVPASAPSPHIWVIDEALRGVASVKPLPLAVLKAFPAEVREHTACANLTASLGQIHGFLTDPACKGREKFFLQRGMTHKAIDTVRELLNKTWNKPPSISENESRSDKAIMAALVRGADARKWAQAVYRILRAILDEWDAPRDSYRGIHVSGEFVVVCRLKQHRIGKDCPVLWLDGTGDPALCDRIIPGLKHYEFAADRVGPVIQSRGKSFSRTSVLGRVSTKEGAKPMSDQKVMDAKILRAKIIKLADSVPGTFLAASKAAKEALVDDGLTSANGHFNALRGLNTWERCPRAIVVGAEMPPIQEIEGIARAYTATDDAPFISMSECWDEGFRAGYFRCTRMRRMRDGSLSPIVVVTHPDPDCDRVIRQVREAEVMQAIDRVRGVYNQRTLILLNDLALPLAIDNEVEALELLPTVDGVAPYKPQGRNRLAEALDAASGVIPLTPALMVLCCPEVWPTEGSAKVWINRYLEQAEAMPDIRVVSYVFGNLRGRPRRALVRSNVASPMDILSMFNGLTCTPFSGPS